MPIGVTLILGNMHVGGYLDVFFELKCTQCEP
jgi:hypothetical protein